MPKRRTQGKQSTTKEEKGLTERWVSLTWDDVDRWAGSRSVTRGRTYQRQGRVKDLVVTDDGRLLATVSGGDRYTVSVWREPGKGKRSTIESTCTCPVGYSGCKHAVAVVAAYLQALADEEAVPTADPVDRRWANLERSGPEIEDDEADEWESHEYDEDEDDRRGVMPRPRTSGSVREGR
ncbi:MAG: SWIM zinc finger family protein [Pirellulales bacterium]|nr:SWIM zinc finger family protein [Pirellulales bacterium]